MLKIWTAVATDVTSCCLMMIIIMIMIIRVLLAIPMKPLLYLTSTIQSQLWTSLSSSWFSTLRLEKLSASASSSFSFHLQCFSSIKWATQWVAGKDESIKTKIEVWNESNTSIWWLSMLYFIINGVVWPKQNCKKRLSWSPSSDSYSVFKLK